MLDFRPLNRKDAVQWAPVSLLLIAMIYTGSKALQFLSVSMFTVFKNVTIIVIAFSEQRLFGNPVSRLMMLSFLLIVLASLTPAAHVRLGAEFGHWWLQRPEL